MPRLNRFCKRFAGGRRHASVWYTPELVHLRCSPRRDYAPEFDGLVGDSWIPADQPGDRNVLSPPRRWEHGGILRLRARRLLVAGRHFDGGHDLCRGYASLCQRRDRHPGHRRQLDLVELMPERLADSVLLRPLLAPL